MGGPLERFREADQEIQYLKWDSVLVRCPFCDQCALLRDGRFSCSNCGRSGTNIKRRVEGVEVWVKIPCGECDRFLSWSGSVPASGAKTMRCECGWSALYQASANEYWSLARGHHPGTGLPLWLRADFRGKVLWAVDEQHLTYLERYVAAGVREAGPGNSTLASRLPAWVKSAKHRPALLRLLRKMRASLPDSPR